MPKTERCPTCKQPIAASRVRFCADCGQPIDLHHKWRFRFRGRSVQMVHRHCKYPESYLTPEQMKEKYGD